MNQIRLLIADDHKVMRDGLRSLFEDETDLAVIGEAETGEEALSEAIRLQPEILILDLGMPGKSGLDVIREIRNQDLEMKIVVLSMYDNQEIILQAVRAGCNGYVTKHLAHTDLLEAIRSVSNGKNYIHPADASAIVNEIVSQQEKELLLQNLSEREKEVLQLTALGYSSREIAEFLVLSSKTVETYRQRVVEKLGFEHRSDLVRFAIRAGLLE